MPEVQILAGTYREPGKDIQLTICFSSAYERLRDAEPYRNRNIKYKHEKGKPNEVRPAPIEVPAGKATITVDAKENGPNPYVVNGLGVDAVDQIAFRMKAARNGEQRCLSEVDVQLRDGPWIYGVPAAAATALPIAISDMTAALRSCNGSSIRRVVHFPVERRELRVGFAGAEMHYADNKPTEYPNVQALRKDCRQLVFPAGETPPRQPELQRTLGPALVRVEGTTGGGVVYWRLAWTAGGWLLIGIEFTDFE